MPRNGVYLALGLGREMSGFQVFALFGLLTATCITTFGIAADLKRRLAAIERRNERQMEMLIALLQKSGVNPVTLD
jgi:hypothetical protein